MRDLFEKVADGIGGPGEFEDEEDYYLRQDTALDSLAEIVRRFEDIKRNLA